MLLAIALSTVFFTACTKESALHSDPISSYSLTGDESVDFNRQYSSTSVSVSGVDTTEVTVQLHVRATSLDTTTNELTVDYSSSFDFTNTLLPEDQDLDFEDTQSNTSTFSLTLNNATEIQTDLQITYDLEQRDLTDLELKETQMIVVQDIIIN